MGRCSSKCIHCELSDIVTIPDTRLVSVQPVHNDDLRPSPPYLKRADIIPDFAMFKKIDTYASKTPRSAEYSVPRLGRHLSKASTDSLGKVRAFYYWICTNVEFDTRSFLWKRRMPVAAEFTLHTKVSLSYGFAELFSELCKLSNIPVQTIYGFVKGYGYDPLKPFKYKQEITHAWNAVYLFGQWCFVDCTFGAGHLTVNCHFKKGFENFYFLTDPENLIMSHFPYINKDKLESKAWQLLQKPVTIDTYNKNVIKTVHFFHLGIELVSHKTCMIDVYESVTIIIKSSSSILTNLSTSLIGVDNTVYKRLTMVCCPSHNVYAIQVRPPKIGKFRFTVLGSVYHNDPELYSIVEYIIKCKRSETKIYLYPKHEGIWRSREDYREFGFREGADKPLIISTNNGKFELKIPTFRDFPVKTNLIYSDNAEKSFNDYILSENIKGAVLIRGQVPNGGFYKLEVLCISNLGEFVEVLLFLIDCSSETLETVMPFPVMYSSASEYHCHLIEPLNKYIPEETCVRIRFISSDIIKAVANGKKMDKEDADIWRSDVRTSEAGSAVRVAGSNENKGRYWVLYEFIVIENHPTAEEISTARAIKTQQMNELARANERFTQPHNNFQ